MKKHPHIKILSHILISILVLNFSLIIPKTERLCTCGKDPERISCCCNCPNCVQKRGGLLSYCQSASRDKDKSKEFVLKKGGCQCGLSDTVLNLPGSTPFILKSQTDYLPPPPVYPFKIENPVLVINDVVTLPDHPG